MAEMLFPLQIKRQYADNIDADYVFDTYTDMDNFKSDPIAYGGMQAYAKDKDGSLFILNNAKTKWIELGGGSGISIVDDYSKLPTAMSSDAINYVKNDYTDTTVTPNVTYSGGFYLWDNSVTPTPSWKLISGSGAIATYTNLGNVKIKKDGGIVVETDGEIHLEDYSKITNPDGTVTITSGGGTYTKDPTTGDITGTTIGGVPVGTTTVTGTSPSGNPTTTTIVSIGGTTTTTTTETGTDPTSGNPISITTVVEDSPTGTTTTTTTTGTDSSGNPTTTTTSTTTTGGIPTSSTTTTTTSGTDPSGNPTSTTTTTTSTPTGTSTHTTTETTDTGTGNKTTVDVTSTSGGGITKTETSTKEEDPSGATISDTTDVTYEGDDDMFATEDDVDSIYNDIFSGLGW